MQTNPEKKKTRGIRSQTEKQSSRELEIKKRDGFTFEKLELPGEERIWPEIGIGVRVWIFDLRKGMVGCRFCGYGEVEEREES